MLVLSWFPVFSRQASSGKTARELKVEDALLYLDKVSYIVCKTLLIVIQAFSIHQLGENGVP